MDEEGSSSTTMEPIMFVLPYLAVFELLTMAQVCKSLRAAVEDDLLPWLRITVDTPLSFRISDYALVHLLAPRAKGRLQVLALINCINITDDALFTVALENPHITKLHIPGCTNLSPEGVITAVKLLTQNNTLHSLRINGLNGLQKEHLYTLRNLIDWYQTYKILYHEYTRLSCSDYLKTDRPIDVDVCPICNQVRMVFDCP